MNDKSGFRYFGNVIGEDTSQEIDDKSIENKINDIIRIHKSKAAKKKKIQLFLIDKCLNRIKDAINNGTPKIEFNLRGIVKDEDIADTVNIISSRLSKFFKIQVVNNESLTIDCLSLLT